MGVFLTDDSIISNDIIWEIINQDDIKTIEIKNNDVRSTNIHSTSG